MLGLIFIYFVGKYFYDLAGQYNKNQWGFAILGVVSYYGGIIVFGFILGIVVEIISPGTIEDDGGMTMIFSIASIFLGIGSCWGTYQLLKHNWSKAKEEPPGARGGTLDSDLINYNQEER